MLLQCIAISFFLVFAIGFSIAIHLIINFFDSEIVDSMIVEQLEIIRQADKRIREIENASVSSLYHVNQAAGQDVIPIAKVRWIGGRAGDS